MPAATPAPPGANARLIPAAAPAAAEAGEAVTRRSLVTHYWRAQDVPPDLVVDSGGGRYYMRRPHQETG